jgi:hypothetical protein
MIAMLIGKHRIVEALVALGRDRDEEEKEL